MNLSEEKLALIEDQADKTGLMIASKVLDEMGITPSSPYFSYHQIVEATQRASVLGMVTAYTAPEVITSNGEGVLNNDGSE